MMLYTSYYAKKIPDHIRRVSISLGFPHWEQAMPRLLDLAPTPEILQIKDESLYKPRYIERLEQLGWENFKRLIWDVSDGFETDVVLLCYESLKTPDQFCHRTMLAEFYNQNHGTNITEFR